MILRPLPALCLVALSAAPARAQVKAEFVAFTGGRPIAVAAPPGETARVFVALKTGSIKLVKDGVLQGTPFLDWSANIDDQSEGGLLGLAFHPDYASNGKFYISYTAPFLTGASVVSQFTVSGDPDVADPASEQIVWGPYAGLSFGHKAGDLRFGPDGSLYFALGDGGDPAAAQDLLQARGSILRFDVDLPHPHVPADNPFVGNPNALDEIWAYGFRNPFRIDVDSVTGDVYVADVGASTREEITRLPAGVGGINAGWPCREGEVCAGGGACNCADGTLVDPIYSYDHSVGCSIIGGVVYRGSAIPSLYGKYLFAEFCEDRIWSFRWDGVGIADFEEHTAAFDGGPGGDNTSIVSFGADGAGEVYMINHYAQRLWKIVPDCHAESYCAANANSTGEPGVIVAGGSLAVSDDAFTLTAHRLPDNEFGYFLNSLEQAFVPNPGGSAGNLCLGGAVGRHKAQIANTGAQGSLSIPVDLTALPRPLGPVAVMAGETWHFTCWYRDGVTSNFTDGVSVVFCP